MAHIYQSCVFTFFISAFINKFVESYTNIEIIEVPKNVFRTFLDDVVYNLYKNYREAIDDGQNSHRRMLKNDKEYKVHVEKLKEVNGFKKHNLKLEIKNGNADPMVYINNPVESKFPHPYLNFEEFKHYLANRVEEQREIFTKLRLPTTKYIVKPTRTRSSPNTHTTHQPVDQSSDEEKETHKSNARDRNIKRRKHKSLNKGVNTLKTTKKLHHDTKKNSAQKKTKKDMDKQGQVIKKADKLKHKTNMFSTKHQIKSKTVLLKGNNTRDSIKVQKGTTKAQQSTSENKVSKIVHTIPYKNDALKVVVIEDDTNTTSSTANSNILEIKDSITYNSELTVEAQHTSEKPNFKASLTDNTESVSNTKSEVTTQKDTEKNLVTINDNLKEISESKNTTNDATIKTEITTESETTKDDVKKSNVSTEITENSTMINLTTTTTMNSRAVEIEVITESQTTTEEKVTSESTEIPQTSTVRQKTKRRTLGRPAVWMGS